MTPSKNADKIRVTLYLPKHLVEEARRDDLSLSALVTVLLREYLTAGRAWNEYFSLIREENREKPCAGRDSNPGRRRGRPAIVFYRYHYQEGARIFIYVRDELIDLGYASKPQLGALLRDIAIFSRARAPGMGLLWDIYSEIQAMLAKGELAKEKWAETQGRNNRRYVEMEGYLSALEDVSTLIKKWLG